MNTLIFLAGMGSGIVLLILVLAIDRRIKKEQREVNDLSAKMMREGNDLRFRRAETLDNISATLTNIAYTIQLVAEKKL